MAAVPALFRFRDVNGTLYPGAKLYTYIEGTTTPLAVFTDSGLTTPSANPAVADSAGRLVVWFDSDKTYKVVIKNAAESENIYPPFDGYSPGADDIMQFIGMDSAASALAAAESAAEAAGYATAAAASAATASSAATAANSDAVAAGASATQAATSETNAAASETAAGTSETNAAASATSASNSATAAATSAANASTSEGNASNYADAAHLDAVAAESAEDGVSTIINEFNFIPGGPFANAAAAAAADGAAVDKLYVGTDDAVYILTAITPTPASAQVSPLTSEQTDNLAEIPDLVTFSENDNLVAEAGLTGAADKLSYYTGVDSKAVTDITAWGRDTLGLTDAAAFRSANGLGIGVHIQPYDADLSAIAALITTSYGRGVLTQADASALKTYMSLGALASASSINNSNWVGADLAIANGGTGQSTASGARIALGAAAALSGTRAARGHLILNMPTGNVMFNWGTKTVSANSTDTDNYSANFASEPYFGGCTTGDTGVDVGDNNNAIIASTSQITLVNGSGSIQTFKYFAFGPAS